MKMFQAYLARLTPSASRLFTCQNLLQLSRLPKRATHASQAMHLPTLSTPTSAQRAKDPHLPPHGMHSRKPAACSSELYCQDLTGAINIVIAAVGHDSLGWEEVDMSLFGHCRWKLQNCWDEVPLSSHVFSDRLMSDRTAALAGVTQQIVVVIPWGWDRHSYPAIDIDFVQRGCLARLPRVALV